MEPDFSRKRGRRSKYSRHFILNVVRQVLEQNMTYRDAALHFNLTGHQQISRWMKKFQDEIVLLKPIGPMAHHSPTVQRNENCAEHANALQKALEQAQLKVNVLETMIDLAESTYKINIRKNFGTKQPD